MQWNLTSTLPSGETVQCDVQTMLHDPVAGSLINVPLQHCYLNGTVTLERPCDLKQGFNVQDRLSVGAFSYTFSHISENVASIGRYCSIAGEVMFGQMEHPTGWLSTSGFQYEPGFMNGFMPGADRTGYVPLSLHGDTPRNRIRIGNDVWIGARSYIKAGVEIGDGAIVGANAVVTKTVPPYAIVVGNPGRIIRFRFAPEIIEQLLELRWWQYGFLDFKAFNPSNIETVIKQLRDRIADGMQPYRPPLARIVGDGIQARFAANEPLPDA